jgi:hypothetical protein
MREKSLGYLESSGSGSPSQGLSLAQRAEKYAPGVYKSLAGPGLVRVIWFS